MSAAPVDLPVPVFKIDAAVCKRAGTIAGEYLDNIGKTDLADLSEGEWSLFCMRMIGSAFILAAEDFRDAEIPF